MYKISRKGGMPKAFRGTMIGGYEAIRSSVRKYIRQHYETSPGENPPIGVYGFKISQV